MYTANILTPVLMMCPIYIDANTSNVVFTHSMGPMLIFTRYDQCIVGVDTPERAEGNWKTARARWLTNTSDEVVADYGFHEKGRVSINRVAWTNGAVWSVPIQNAYYSSDESMVFAIDSNNYGTHSVRELKTNKTIGVMQQVCQDVFLNGRKGMIKGNVIGWSDGDIWWSGDLETEVGSGSDGWEEDEARDDYDASYYGDFLDYSYDTWRRNRRARQRRRI